MCDRGGGGVSEKAQTCMTSFVNDPQESAQDNMKTLENISQLFKFPVNFKTHNAY